MLMNEDKNQIELFEFTNEEEKNITETTLALTELMCTFVSQGVSISEDRTQQTTIVDIIGHIIGEDRKKSLNFAMISTKVTDGQILVNGFISKKSQNFLQHLLTYQLELLETNIPLAVEYATQHNNLLHDAGTNIYSLPFNKDEKQLNI
jgi:hypothetical protein